MNLYVFSKNEMKKDLSAQYLNLHLSGKYKNEGNYPFVDSLLGKFDGYLTKYRADSLNVSGRPLNKLKDDPFFLAAEI